MSKRKDILELLKKETLSAFEISDKTDCPIEFVRVYLGQFIKEKKIKITGTKDNHKVYGGAVDPITLLKQLYGIMIEYMKVAEQIPKEKLEIIDKIGGVVESE